MSPRWNPYRKVDSTFYTLFERAGEYMVEAADALHTFFETDPMTAEAFANLDEIEHKADVVTHDLLSRIERGFRAPLTPEDTRQLTGHVDSIVDATESAGELCVLLHVECATPVAREMTAVLQKAAREVASLLGYLEQGSGHRPYVARVHEYEHQGDELWTQGISELFDGSRDPLDVIKWDKIYEQLEGAIDGCETTARFIDRALTGQSKR